jgi:uncharacterized membrane protein
MTQDSTKNSLQTSSSSQEPVELDGELRRYVETAIKPNLEGLPEQTVELVIREVTTMVAMSGPLPPPTQTREYEAISPGFTDRSLKLAERAQEAAIEAEIDERDKNQFYRILGLSYAAFLVALLIIGGVVIAVLVNPYVGAGTAVAGVVASAVAMLVQGRPLSDGDNGSKQADRQSPSDNPPKNQPQLPARRGKVRRK